MRIPARRIIFLPLQKTITMKNLLTVIAIFLSFSLAGQTPVTVVDVKPSRDTVEGFGVLELLLCEVRFDTGTRMQILVSERSKLKVNERVFFFEEPRRIVKGKEDWYCYFGNVFYQK